MPKSKHGGFMYRELNVLVYVYVYVWPLNEQRPGNHRDRYTDKQMTLKHRLIEIILEQVPEFISASQFMYVTLISLCKILEES